MAHRAEVSASPEEGHGVSGVRVGDVSGKLCIVATVYGGVVGALDGIHVVNLTDDAASGVGVGCVAGKSFCADPDFVDKSVGRDVRESEQGKKKDCAEAHHGGRRS